MTAILLLAAALGLSWLVSWRLTGRVLSWLRQRAILDHPNDRSSHAIPTRAAAAGASC
ncbi:hypothetical protein [Azospirillum thermophilum]|uniref:hypothetical protein n=1 Tax=Azospirillum thermophilum TaxID=2202148 RepID=UPI001FE2A90E|nr:hypothetical protein [Azospirillum thermophilum]